MTITIRVCQFSTPQHSPIQAALQWVMPHVSRVIYAIPSALFENVALAKKFQFGEKVQAELRMEYFNLLNRMQVCGPSDANVSDLRTAANPNANFGYVVGPCQGNTPRQGQAYFRINF